MGSGTDDHHGFRFFRHSTNRGQEKKILKKKIFFGFRKYSFGVLKRRSAIARVAIENLISEMERARSTELET